MSLYMLRRAGIYVFLSVAAFLSVFPFLWMALGATNKSTDIVTGKLSVGSNLLVNFQNLLAQVDLLRIFGNSFLIAICPLLSSGIITFLKPAKTSPRFPGNGLR